MRISDWSSDVCSSDLNAVLDHEHGATDIQRKGTVPYSTVHILNRGISRHLRNTGIRRVVMENVDPDEALAGDRTKVADTLFLGPLYRTCPSRSTCAHDFLGNGSSDVDLLSANPPDAPAHAHALAPAYPTGK